MPQKNGSTKQKWTKEAIRREIKRLDGITGLKGADVTVRLYDEPEPLGCFTFKDPARMTFGFSSTRFEEPGFTDAEALDIIRHEYAHFMEYRLFGESTDHGPNWKKCCIRIGARPDRLYTDSWKEDARKAEKERARRTRTDGFSQGMVIHHPAFGDGVIERIEQTTNMTKLTIAFGDRTRVLDIDWVRKNCMKTEK